jgi:hypothetical protein
VPEFDMVVVTAFPGSDLRRLLIRMIAELTTLSDWHAFNSSCPVGPAFQRFDNGWGIRAWPDDNSQYKYFAVDDLEPGLSARLDQLHQALEAGQQHRLDESLLEAGPGQVRTAKDTAWRPWGTDREVLVYGRSGRLQAIDFDETKPRLLHTGRSEYPANARGPLEAVKAADLATYRKLSQYYWVTRSGGQSIDASGTVSDNLAIATNGEARAYVRPGELVQLGEQDPYGDAARRSGVTP